MALTSILGKWVRMADKLGKGHTSMLSSGVNFHSNKMHLKSDSKCVTPPKAELPLRKNVYVVCSCHLHDTLSSVSRTI